MKKLNRIEGTFHLDFTTGDELPKASQMKAAIEDIFSHVLDSYLHSNNIEGNEVHFVMCDDFTITKEQDD